jgi:hypothetical protein
MINLALRDSIHRCGAVPGVPHVSMIVLWFRPLKRIGFCQAPAS